MEVSEARYVGFTYKNNNDHPYVQRDCSDCGVKVWVNSERMSVIEQMKLICESCATSMMEDGDVAGWMPAEVLDGARGPQN